MPVVGEEDATVLREGESLAHKVMLAVRSVAQTPFTLDAILAALDAPTEPPCHSYWVRATLARLAARQLWVLPWGKRRGADLGSDRWHPRLSPGGYLPVCGMW